MSAFLAILGGGRQKGTCHHFHEVNIMNSRDKKNDYLGILDILSLLVCEGLLPLPPIQHHFKFHDSSIFNNLWPAHHLHWSSISSSPFQEVLLNEQGSWLVHLLKSGHGEPAGLPSSIGLPSSSSSSHRLVPCTSFVLSHLLME